MSRRQWVIAAAAVFGIITVLVILAPFMAPYGTFRGLDGAAGYIDHGWQGHGVAGVMYLLCDMFCHQEEARCYMLNGSQLPVCIRDVGILAGLFVGFLACIPLGSRVSDRRFSYAGVVLVLIMVAEWAAESFIGDMPVPRLLSGICAGVGAAIFLCWLLYRDGKDDFA